MNVRPIACFAAVLGAALLLFPLATGAQQSVQVAQAAKRPVPQTPAGRYASLRDTLNQNTVTVISGNPNGTYLYLAYDMSAVLDDGNDLRILPIIGKGGYQNVLDTLRALRARFGNWFTVERSLPISHSQRVEITEGRTEVSTTIAFRIAKLLEVSLHDVLQGLAVPKNTCPHCGREI